MAVRGGVVLSTGFKPYGGGGTNPNPSAAVACHLYD